MAHIDDLAPELFIAIVEHLVLKSLISARGVCRRWRNIVSPDSSTIPITRRRLLRLYLRVIKMPFFIQTRSRIIPSLVPFARESGVALLSESISQEYKTWILEWPARAVFLWMWPGLQADGQPRHPTLSSLLQADETISCSLSEIAFPCPDSAPSRHPILCHGIPHLSTMGHQQEGSGQVLGEGIIVGLVGPNYVVRVTSISLLPLYLWLGFGQDYYMLLHTYLRVLSVAYMNSI